MTTNTPYQEQQMATSAESTDDFRNRPNTSRNLDSAIVKRAVAGDEQAVAAVVARIEPFIQQAIGRLSSSSLPHDDLAQDARIAVLEYLPDFDPEMDVKVETYLYLRVAGAVMDAAPSYFSGLPLGSSTSKRYFRAKAVTDSDVEARKYATTQLGMNPETWDRSHAVVTGVWSADDSDGGHVYEGFESSVTASMAIKEAIGSIDERDALIVTLSFGLDGGPRLTDAEISKEVGVERSRVCRLRQRALSNLGEVLV